MKIGKGATHVLENYQVKEEAFYVGIYRQHPEEYESLIEAYKDKKKSEGQLKYLTSINTSPTRESKQRDHLGPCRCSALIADDVEVIENRDTEMNILH